MFFCPIYSGHPPFAVPEAKDNGRGPTQSWGVYDGATSTHAEWEPTRFQ
jgi:hypothetical protein